MAKILLVEDDKSLREIYGVRLMAEGYEIVSAGDGEEALAVAIKERPDLIISDVMMPKISGFDMLDILRSTTETKDVKVIMMTALSSEDQRARGESLGADRYLVKSQVGIEDVVRTVHEVIGDSIQTAQQPATPAQFGAAPAVAAPDLTSVPPIPAQPVASAVEPAPVPEQPIEIPPVPLAQPEVDPAAEAAMPAPEAPAPVVPQAAPLEAPIPPVPQVEVAPAPAPAIPEQPVTEPIFVPVDPVPAAPEVAAPPQPAPAPLEAPIPPVPQVEATPAPAPVTPEQPAMSQQPVAPAPVPAPVAPQPAPEAVLPQPTAPFSSPAPASLGERVIEPLVNPASAPAAGPQDIAAQMAQALGTDPSTPQQPPAGQQ